MNWIVAVLKAIWALFVDDIAFAAMVIGWLALAYLLATLGFGARWEGALLFGGLALILTHGALRKARRG